MHGWRKRLASMDSQSYSPREFGISALQPRTARDCAFIALGAANTEGAFFGSISGVTLRDSRRVGATAQRVQIPARAASLRAWRNGDAINRIGMLALEALKGTCALASRSHAGSSPAALSNRPDVGLKSNWYSVAPMSRETNIGERAYPASLLATTPTSAILPQPKSSTGTTQSRRFPARARKVIASAGQPQKRGSAEPRSWRKAQQTGRLDRTPLDFPAVSGMPHVRTLVRAGGGFERYAVGALSSTDN